MAHFHVWWVPQVPGRPFIFDVPGIEEGILLCQALAEYDIFQFENNIKPDFANAGGMSYRLTEADEWEDFDPDDPDEVTAVRNELFRSDLDFASRVIAMAKAAGQT